MRILSPFTSDKKNPHVVISECVCTCVCGCTHVCACGAQKLTLGFFLNCSPSGSLHWAQSSPVWLDYLARELMGSTCLCCSPRAGDTYANLLQPAFYMGAGHPNSGHHGCVASPLCTEWPSQWQYIVFFLHVYFHQVLLGFVRGLPLMNKKFQ